MRYDRTFKRYKFSTDQFIETEKYQELINEYNQFRMDVLKGDIRNFGRDVYGAAAAQGEESSGSKVKNIILAVLFVGAFISLILALVLKKIMLFGIIFCSLFFIAGIMLIVTGRADPRDSASKALRSRIMGVAITLASGAILALIILHERFTEAQLLVWIASLVFGLSGLTLIAIAIVDKLSARILYTEEIDAKCTGYVRMVDSESSDNSSGTNRSHPIIYVMTSPLFEYNYEGVKYESVYDSFPIKDYSDIELDSITKIRINPKHPEDVLSSHVTSKTNFATFLIFGIIFAAVGSGLAWYSLLGGTKNLTVETSWNALIDGGSDQTEDTAPAKNQITDEMVESAYKDDINGKDWYYEITTVTNVEDYNGNLLLSFDDSFEKMQVKSSAGFKTGDKVLLLYTVSLETPDQKTGYKQGFVYGKPDEVEYVGSHTAYGG